MTCTLSTSGSGIKGDTICPTSPLDPLDDRMKATIAFCGVFILFLLYQRSLAENLTPDTYLSGTERSVASPRVASNIGSLVNYLCEILTKYLPRPNRPHVSRPSPRIAMSRLRTPIVQPFLRVPDSWPNPDEVQLTQDQLLGRRLPLEDGIQYFSDP